MLARHGRRPRRRGSRSSSRERSARDTSRTELALPLAHVHRVLNVATFALYATIGAQFFLLVYQLQVSAGWSALAAGSALIPATLPHARSAPRGPATLAARIGPRPQLVHRATAASRPDSCCSLRIGRDAEWVGDVLPGALLFGFGLVAFVAPLTASVMGSVDESFVSTASGVNNAIARTGGLFAVALIPSVSGLTTAVGPAATTDAFRTGMWIAAGLAVVASIVVGGRAAAPRSRHASERAPLHLPGRRRPAPARPGRSARRPPRCGPA